MNEHQTKRAQEAQAKAGLTDATKNNAFRMFITPAVLIQIAQAIAMDVDDATQREAWGDDTVDWINDHMNALNGDKELPVSELFPLSWVFPST